VTSKFDVRVVELVFEIVSDENSEIIDIGTGFDGDLERKTAATD
jgi:hypothetical protein